MVGKKKISLIISIISILIVLLIRLTDKDISSKKELKHFYNKTTDITDLSENEQAELLAVFNVVIPEEESTAYISALKKCDTQYNSYFLYLIEFSEVKSYRAFYDANIHRIDENGYGGLSYNQMLGLTDKQLKEGYFSEKTDGVTDHYLTYSELVGPRDDQTIAELFDELYSKRINEPVS